MDIMRFDIMKSLVRKILILGNSPFQKSTASRIIKLQIVLAVGSKPAAF